MNRSIIFSLLLVLIFTSCTLKRAPLTPETALNRYLNNNDNTFLWEVKDTFEINGLKVAILKMISQKWREYEWVHQVTIISPEGDKNNLGLLFINGGSNKNGEPNWRGRDDDALQMMSAIAAKNNATVTILSQVPNQPLYDTLKEDALISFTLHNFRSDRDFTWPLLFPMVKSAVRAMDAVEEYSAKERKKKITRFVVSGASKRGWTTWLTGSQDRRVVAIAPMVIDVLNMPVNIDYQKEVWGDYSIQIEDYVNLGIAQDINTADGRELTTMIDPYSYRSALTMPKLIFIGTNDEYWPVDAVKHYINELPGENYIHYVPNAGHDLGDKKQAIQALSAFFKTVLDKAQHPHCNWSTYYDSTKVNLSVTGSPELKEVILWECNSPDRDFRNDIFAGQKIEFNDISDIEVQVNYPEKGFRAFYIDLVYPDAVDGVYSKSTRMFVCSEKELLLN